MAVNRRSYIPTTNYRASILELQEQAEYTLDVDIRQGDKITASFGKTFYKAEWIDKNESRVILMEIKGNKVIEEAYLYLTLEHPHIIKTYGLVNPNNYKIDPNSLLLLQEYARDGDLGGLLSNNYFVPEQSALLEIFIQVADAMIFLSTNNIIHGDLACRNVLVFQSHPHNPKQNLVKLIDFGSTQKNSKSSDQKIDIPVRYAAPEILCSDGISGYSEKSDVYSFGVCMREACSFGKIPYEHINDDNEVCRKKLLGERLTRPDKCDPNIWKLMNLCWIDRPSDRPTFQMIYTQLKNIQNVDSLSSHSNLGLFEVEYKTCDDCHLRYTDGASHLKTCSEQKLICFKCNKQYRRAIYDDHEKNCNGSSDDTSKKKSPVPTIPSNNDRSHFNSLFELNRSIHTPQERPSLSSDISTRRKPATQPRTSVPENLRIQLPCEFCPNLFNASQLHIHQIECNKRDQERIERKRREVEQTEATVKIQCDSCNRKYSIEDYDNHLNTCSSNPKNIPVKSPFQSSSRSISVPDFLTTRKLSNSLDELNNIMEDDHRPGSSVNFKNSKIVKTTKLPIKKDDRESSTFQKFVLRLWPFKKKET